MKKFHLPFIVAAALASTFASSQRSTARDIESGPSFLSRPFSTYGVQRVQFLLFYVGGDELDSDVQHIVQQRMGQGRTHEANRHYWVNISQDNDEQLVMAWYDATEQQYQWIRIRWHRDTSRVLQVTNDSMTRWTNLRYGDSRRFSYAIGQNRYVLEIQNPSATGDWDSNDVIYSFSVYDR